MADRKDHQRYWFIAGAACGTVALAMIAAAASLGSSTSRLAPGSPFLVIAYVSGPGAVACFIAGVRMWPFPLAAAERSDEHQESVLDCGPILRPGGRLSVGEALWAGAHDGPVRFSVRHDGNLVASYGEPVSGRWQTLWDSHTSSAEYLAFREDGNMVLCADDDTVIIDWCAGGMGGKRLEVQGDGNVVLYADENRPVWATDRLKGGRFVRPAPPGERAQPKRRVAGPGGSVRWVDF